MYENVFFGFKISDSVTQILLQLGFIIIIIMTRRQLRSVATTLHDDRNPVPSSTPV